MIFTAIGIVFLLTLGFLVITWVAWFTFLWLSKLWYEASQTNLNRTSVRDLITNSFAVPVYLLCVFYRRTTNRISKMNDKTRVMLLIALLFGSLAIGWWGGYTTCYRDNFSGQAEEQLMQEYYGIYTIDSTTIITQLGLDKEQALEFHKEEVSTLKRELRDTTKLTYKFW